MPGFLTALPSPDSGWMLVDRDRVLTRGATLAEVAGRRADVVIGLPASRLSTFCVSLPKTDPALYESMIFAQIEKRGLAASSRGETMFDFVPLRSEAPGVRFAVSVVPPLDENSLMKHAGGYAPAAALRPAPSGGARLWREQGRLIFGIYEDREPLHVQALSGTTKAGAAAAQEISLLLLSLSGDEAVAEWLPSGIEVAVAGLTEAEKAELEKGLSLPVTDFRDGVETAAAPAGRLRLLPASVQRFRRSRSLGRKLSALGVVLLAGYLIAASWFWVEGKSAVREIASLERQIAIVEPDVTRIQQISQRWDRLEPAFEKKWFPLVQLNGFTSALPGSGVVVREFRTTGRSVRVRGQARDVQLANRLLEDLRAMEHFSEYDWSMPNPKVEKNNTATFEIEGKPKDAGADS